METIVQNCPLIVPNEHTYEFLLGVSADCLLVLDKNNQLVEWIVIGNNTDGVIAAARNEDEFLDSIIIIKQMINNNQNPLLWLRK